MSTPVLSLTHYFFLSDAEKSLPVKSDAWKCRFGYWLLSAYRITRDNMPPKNGKQANQYGVNFVQINLSQDDQAKFTGWRSTLSDAWPDEFSTVVADGFKIGLTWDDNNACFIASMTGKVEGAPNYNSCITARSNDWIEALQLLHFKHEVVCSGGMWSKHQTSVAWG